MCCYGWLQLYVKYNDNKGATDRPQTCPKLLPEFVASGRELIQKLIIAIQLRELLRDGDLKIIP